jgi:membrane-bound lytic murein transglycosylase MltF
VNIRDIHDPEKNIHAAVKYMDFLRDRYFDHEQYASNETINFILAAYNAGPAKIRSLQTKAKKLGLNQYVWFSNMERVVLRYVGREPVRYVANIHKYYVAYRMLEHSRHQRKQELQEFQSR